MTRNQLALPADVSVVIHASQTFNLLQLHLFPKICRNAEI
jgi:hypothetical protein